MLLPRLNRTGRSRRTLLIGILFLCVFALLVRLSLLCLNDPTAEDISSGVIGSDASHSIYISGDNGGGAGPLSAAALSSRKFQEYNRNVPLIFIGGVPRSGTTLMRAMLDAHPDVRCGQETRVIPRLLQLRFHWYRSEKEANRLEEAGITKEVLDSAIAAFMLEIIAKHGEPAPRLCNKDPLTIKMGSYVIDLFPNAKFIFMVRDGRATAHSIISRKVTITGFDLSSYRRCLKKWNSAVEAMNNQCKTIGPSRCLRVPYEQLVLHPRKWMQNVLEYLEIPWNESVLHHEDFINKGVSLSKVERSSDQVIKPVNLEALTKWQDHIPEDVIKDMAEIAPMLSVLGYDPYERSPNYGQPDEEVAVKTRDIEKHKLEWERKAELFDLVSVPETGGGGGGGGDSLKNGPPQIIPAGETGFDREFSESPGNATR